jgi:hypothetical protein
VSNTFFGVAVDCVDAAALAQFWADVLGRGGARWTTFGDIEGNEFDLIAS